MDNPQIPDFNLTPNSGLSTPDTANPDEVYYGTLAPNEQARIIEDEADKTRAPQGVLGTALDWLNRLSYSSVAFFDRLVGNKTGNFLEAAVDGAAAAGRELVHPNERLSWTDIIHKHIPDLYNASPVASNAIGLIMDVATDPLTYTSFGATGLRKIAGKVVGEGGEKFAQKIINDILQKKLAPEFMDMAPKILPDLKQRAFENARKNLADKIIPEAQKLYHQMRGTGMPHDLTDEYLNLVAGYLSPQELTDFINKWTPRSMKSIGQKGVPHLGKFFQELMKFDPALSAADQTTKGAQKLARVLQKSQINPVIEALDSETVTKIVRSELMRHSKAGIVPDHILQMLPDRIRSKVAKDMVTNLQTEMYGSLKDFIRLHYKDMPAIQKEALEQMFKQIQKTTYSPLLAQIGHKTVPTSSKMAMAEQVVDFMKKVAVPDYLKGRTPQEFFDTFLTETVKEPLDLVQTAGDYATGVMGELIKAGQADKYNLLDKGGLRFAGKTILSGDWIGKKLSAAQNAFLTSSVGKAFKLDKIAEHIKESKFIQGIHDFLGDAFNRNYKLPDEYVKLRERFEGMYGSAKNRIETDVLDKFKKVDPKRLPFLGQIMANIEDQTFKLKEVLKQQNQRGFFRGMIPGEAALIVQNELKKHNLSVDEYNLIRTVYRSFNESGKMLLEAKLIPEMYKNYLPHVYKNIQNGAMVTGRMAGLSIFLPAGQKRTYMTLNAAKAAGLDPEMNLATLYFTRMFEAERTVLKKDFKSMVRSKFGNTSDWNRIQQDIDFIGESSYPIGLSEGIKKALGIYDKGLNLFKRMATTMRPAFAAKQVISNFLQTAAVVGLKDAMKIPFDLHADLDAMAVLLYKNKILDSEAMAKMDKYFGLASDFGYKYTMKDILKIVDSGNVMRGSALGVEKAAREVTSLLESEARYKRLIGPAHEGIAKLVVEAGKYMNWPSHIEDLSRLAVTLNGLKGGLDPATAISRMNKALFDYQHGLSKFEQQWMKRFIPFYSFNRFAIPLVANTLLHKPGDLANIGKTTKAFFEALNDHYNGKQLSPQQRNVLPNYLLDQFNANSVGEINDGGRLKQQFMYMTNFNFMDSMAQIETDKHGNIDWAKTFRQHVLGQLTPILKVPLELLYRKQFFNDKYIFSKDKLTAGAMGKLNQNDLLSNLTGAVAAYVGGASGWFPEAYAGQIAKTGTHELLTKLTPDQRERVDDVVKWVTGWEDGRDKDGQPTIYMNPTRIYWALSLIPSLSTVIRSSDEHLNPTQRAADLLFGLKTTTVDVNASLKKSTEINRNQMKTMVSEMHRALRMGLTNEAEDRRKELIQLMNDMYISQKLGIFNNMEYR